MQHLISSLLLAFLIITFNHQAVTAKRYQYSPSEKVSKYLINIEKKGFSGSVLVDFKGEKILSFGYGNSNNESSTKNTSETIFDIGSITKQFTGAAILKLEMQNKLTVHDKISKYFEGLPNDKKNITIHHLLTHSSGLIESIGNDYSQISEKEFVDKVLKSKLLSQVGKTYNYSNVGYSLLALIIEKASGMTYEKYLQTYLFQPANMKRTGYILPDWDQDKIAVGYNGNRLWGKPNEQEWAKDGPYLHLKGNGGILSTTEDMYKWHQVLLSNKILNDKAKKKYYARHIKEGEGARSYYGYGWAVFPTPRNTDLITHNGGNGVFFGDFWRYITEEVTIIVLTNKSNRYSPIIASQIAGILLNPDFEPTLPENIAQNGTSDEQLIETAKKTFNILKDEGENEWKEFIANDMTQEFEKMAPIDTHLSFFKKFNARLANGKIIGVAIEDDEIILLIKTPQEEFDMVLIIEPDQSGILKVGGIMLD